VIDRRHLRQSHQSRSIHALPLPASPLNLQLLTFNLPLFLPFRLSSSTFDRSLTNVPFPKFFSCHTSENSLVSLATATDPKTPSRKSYACHTSETPGAGSQHSNHRPSNIQTIPQSIPFLFKFFRTLLHFFALARNSTLFFSSDSALFAQNHPGGGSHESPAVSFAFPAFNRRSRPAPSLSGTLLGLSTSFSVPFFHRSRVTEHGSRATVPH
jgi:hypothetical protein